MRLPQFEYFSPKTLDEACGLLERLGPRALPLAGGTDLLIKMKHRRLVPECLVNIKNISGLDRITYDEELGLSIGAMVTIQALKASALVERRAKLLHEAAAVQSSIQIRNSATIGGNIANASPAGDGPLALLVADARVILHNSAGTRELAVADIFRAPGRTALRRGELVEEIRLPPIPPQTGVAHVKHALRRTDIAIVSTAVVLTIVDGICSNVRIGLGSVAPTIARAPTAEKILVGQKLDDALIDAAADAAANDA